MDWLKSIAIDCVRVTLSFSIKYGEEVETGKIINL